MAHGPTERVNYLPPAPKDIAAWGEPLRTVPSVGRVQQFASVPPFWQFKPPGGIDLYGTDTDTLAAAVNATVTLSPTPRWRINPSYRGVLQSLVIGVTSPLATMDITFTLLSNDAPVPGWDAFKPPAFAANGVLIPFTGPLQLEDVNLTVRVTNNAATGPWVVSAVLSGWQWPRVLEQQTFGTAGG